MDEFNTDFLTYFGKEDLNIFSPIYSPNSSLPKQIRPEEISSLDLKVKIQFFLI